MRFEDRKFCQISTICARWECSRDLVYDLVSKGRLEAWHPEGSAGSKGMRIVVRSVIELEESGKLRMSG